MAPKGKGKSQAGLNLGYTFFRELWRFYSANRGYIRSHYHKLTRIILDYNDPSRPRKGQFLRQPQFEALEMYVFLKEYLKLKPVHEIFADWYAKQGGFERRKAIAGLDGTGVLSEEFVLPKDAYEAVFNKMKESRQQYANYIFALSMGVGKTLLMATCIFYDFVLADKFPDDPLFCHNALIFAPDKTVLQSLREIETFDFSKVMPEAQANWLQANLKLQYLDEAGTTLNVLNNSEYNLIITNTQKILLKKKNKAPSAVEELFLAGTTEKSSDSVYDAIRDLYEFDNPEDELELTTNQRYRKLSRLPQLGVFVDEAHHAFGESLRKDLLDPLKETSLRFTINVLAKELENSGKRMVACCNYTGTPYVKNEILPEVVYNYRLKAAIDNGYLKTLRLHKYQNTRDREFVAAVVDNFLEKFGDRRLEGMLPKLAFFSPSIEDANDNLRPILTEILESRGISPSSLLVNVGDPKITSNDAIRAFNELDTAKSDKQFLILVNKGKEGWNCRSLCGVAMFRQPKSKIFVLQASMRCLRAIGDRQEEGQVYLTEDNAAILNDELQQNFRISADELEKAGRTSREYQVRILKSKSVKLNRVKSLFRCDEKTLDEPVSFGMADWDVDKYKITHTEETTTLDRRSNQENLKPEDISRFKARRKWSELTIVSEISRYLGYPALKVEKILAESEEGLPAILQKVNDYNELLYDKVIPFLFSSLFEITPYEHQEEIEVKLVNDPSDGYFTVHGDPDKTQQFSPLKPEIEEFADKSFHLDTYCFDSEPEQDFFLKVIGEPDISEIYFTGMLTHGQSDFLINYIDPDTGTVRSYYPDFLLKTRENEWIVVEVKAANMIDVEVTQAKREFAERAFSKSRISYEMVPHNWVKEWKPGYKPAQQEAS